MRCWPVQPETSKILFSKLTTYFLQQKQRHKNLICEYNPINCAAVFVVKSMLLVLKIIFLRFPVEPASSALT
jgi:Ni,Fe-hydrogenase I cytochrome b subunit